MLQLKNIKKNYYVGDVTVTALNDVSLNFRESEFVSILGASGCGKTTLLNIIGGLDRYTEGDIVINGVSTKDYGDKDWDSYRNHSVGFVFQSYNLIPHQSVLKNVELALTLSGIKREERRERAKTALEKVGLGDQLNKKPNQMSGGQMQRVAIARAIVNNPDIILADEPTGALDTETSVQVMEILKELSKTKLVVMVTHNPELAERYSTRIINLKDGFIIGDTMPLESVEEKPVNEKFKAKKPSMSFWTALSLSFNNLATKKARTLLTSFAGSIGIIGIALILSLSSGFNSYVSRVQQESLTNYPLTISQTSFDPTSIFTSYLSGAERDGEKYPVDQSVSTQNKIGNMINSISATKNDLNSFKKHVDENLDKNLVSGISYSYATEYKIYREQTVTLPGKPTVTAYNAIYPTKLPPLEDIVPIPAGSMNGYYELLGSFFTSKSAWCELLDNKELIESQYDVLKGSLPNSANELVLVVDEYNQIDDLSLYMLGLMTNEDISYVFNEMILRNTPKPDGSKMTEEEIKDYIENTMKLKRSQMTYSFDDILNLEYVAVLDGEQFEKAGENADFGNETKTQLFKKMSDEDFQTHVKNADNEVKLKISGIVRLKENITNGSINGRIGYTSDLTNLMIERNNELPVVKEYLAEAERAIVRADGASTDGYYVNIFDGSKMSEADYKNLASGIAVDGKIISPTLSAIDVNTPTEVRIYAKSFDSKEKIVDFIQEYNDSNEEEKQIKYTDLVGVMMESITVIINAITYILIAFVSISLVVSSIMIGIITYISVLERTKEIGVLRSIGASKRDVKRVFNAETIIIGFVAGTLGILLTVILNVPINFIIASLSGIKGVAKLPVLGAIILIAISVFLTTIAGLFPASIASKKDPVVALRTE